MFRLTPRRRTWGNEKGDEGLHEGERSGEALAARQLISPPLLLVSDLPQVPDISRRVDSSSGGVCVSWTRCTARK